ncbi:MAG: alpha/beta hydrolase [Xanthomonadales bacterium]|nr:alpha/beta hydrolase [Xanthomonadales bacterium]
MSTAFRTIRCNGLAMKLAEANPPAAPETAPLVILAHGWPESWYSWRHQMGPLAEAGYRVVAPRRGAGHARLRRHGRAGGRR